MERRRVVFSGRVQGVGFRMTAKDVARGHLVTGWVRNEDDGSVLLEVQGEREVIEAFLVDLRGRMGRVIKGETAMPGVADAAENGFEIRH